jgi:hypothetical protein
VVRPAHPRVHHERVVHARRLARTEVHRTDGRSGRSASLQGLHVDVIVEVDFGRASVDEDEVRYHLLVERNLTQIDLPLLGDDATAGDGRELRRRRWLARAQDQPEEAEGRGEEQAA